MSIVFRLFSEEFRISDLLMETLCNISDAGNVFVTLLTERHSPETSELSNFFTHFLLKVYDTFSLSSDMWEENVKQTLLEK